METYLAVSTDGQSVTFDSHKTAELYASMLSMHGQTVSILKLNDKDQFDYVSTTTGILWPELLVS